MAYRRNTEKDNLVDGICRQCREDGEEATVVAPEATDKLIEQG